MKNNWQQVIFTPEDLEAGDYIVRETSDKFQSPFIKDSGFLSTILYKIGWYHNKLGVSNFCIISMSDGMIATGYYLTKDKDGNQIEDINLWKFMEFKRDTSYDSKSVICDYLNNNPHQVTYRRATQEEVMRVILYQKHRCA